MEARRAKMRNEEEEGSAVLRNWKKMSDEQPALKVERQSPVKQSCNAATKLERHDSAG